MSESIITHLSDPLVEKIKTLSNYPSEEERKYCMDHLREWIKSTPYLPQDLDDAYIYRYLFGCKFNLQETKKKLENYLLMRSQHPQIYSNLDVKAMSTSQVSLSVLPEPTSDGCRVYCIYDHSDDFDLTIVLKNFLMLCQYVAHNEKHPIHGFIIMIKSDNMTLKKYFKWTPYLLKLVINTLQVAPESLKGIFILNAPDYVKPIMDLIKKFASRKISERIYFNEPEKLFEKLSKESIPHEFGGDGPSCIKISDKILYVLEDEKEWFEEHEHLKADLLLYEKVQNETTPADMNSVQGSFKKLCVD